MKKSFKFFALFFVFLFNFTCLLNGTNLVYGTNCVEHLISLGYEQIRCSYFDMDLIDLFGLINRGLVPVPKFIYPFDSSVTKYSETGKNKNSKYMEIYFYKDKNKSEKFTDSVFGVSGSYFKCSTDLLAAICNQLGIDYSNVCISENSRININPDDLKYFFNNIVKPTVKQKCLNTIKAGTSFELLQEY